MSLKSYAFVSTIAQAGAGITTVDVPVTGYLKGLALTVGEMTGASTLTLTVKDKNGLTVFTRGSIPHSATTTIWADKYNELSTTKVEGALLNTPMLGPVDVSIQASVIQDDAAVDFTTYIYYES
jgi:hypothetical protein